MPDLQQCKAVQDGYTTEDSIVANFGGYQYVSVHRNGDKKQRLILA